MTFKTYKNFPHDPTHPDRAPLRGGRVAIAAPVHEVMKAQDGVLGHGARVLANVGLAGRTAFQADAAVDPMETQTHPRFDVYRAVIRCKVRLTPGYSVRFRGTFVRSGIQQKSVSGSFPYVGTGGAVRCVVAYDNGVDALTQIRIMTPLASPNADGAEPTDAGASFGDIHTQDFEVFPPSINFSAEVAQRWAENVTATITVSYRGSPRVVDLVVYEAPVMYARDTADDPDSYTIPVHTDGGGKPLPQYPSYWPVKQRTLAGDVSSGSIMALAVSTRQAAVLGPVALYWSAFKETLGPAETEAEPMRTTTDSFAEISASGVSEWRSTNAGQAGGSVGTARRADLCGPLELRGVVAVLPVRVRVFGRVNDAAYPGVVRIMAAEHSVAEVVIDSETLAWHESIAWVKCGLNGDDPQTWQRFYKSAGGGEWCDVLYIVVEFEPQA